MQGSMTVLVASPDEKVVARLASLCSEFAAGVVLGAGEGADAAVVDAGMPDMVRRISATMPVVAVGSTYGVPEIVEAILHGARGYLPAGSPGRVLSRALDQVVAGEFAVPQVLLMDVIDELVRRALEGPGSRRISLVS